MLLCNGYGSAQGWHVVVGILSVDGDSDDDDANINGRSTGVGI